MITINLNFIILRHTQQKSDHIIISCRYFMIEVVWDTYDIAKFTGSVPRLPVAVNVCDILYHGISCPVRFCARIESRKLNIGYAVNISLSLLLLHRRRRRRRCVSAAMRAPSRVHLSKYQRTYQMIGSANTILLSCRIILSRASYDIMILTCRLRISRARVVHNRKGGK